MALDWENVLGIWEDHEIGLIADVDCTTDAKPLCNSNRVKVFPALKYEYLNLLEDYKGRRTYADFEKFATDNLKPVCSVTNLALYDYEKKAFIETLMVKSEAKLDAEIKTFEDLLPHYHYNPVKIIKTSTMGTIAMLRLAKRVRVRILLTSTSEVYGDPEVHVSPESFGGSKSKILDN